MLSEMSGEFRGNHWLPHDRNSELPPSLRGIGTAFRLENVGKGIVPFDWQSRLDTIAETAQPSFLQGGAAGSLEMAGTQISYKFLDGKVLSKIPELEWLMSLYEGRFLDLAQRVTGETLQPASDDASQIVMNVTADQGYEWHQDTNRVTAILYGTTGGALKFRIKGLPQEVVYKPKAGDVFFFRGQKLPHAVEGTPYPRISLPMNYYSSDQVPSMPEAVRQQVGN